MKKALTILGIASLLVILFIAGSMLITRHNASQYQQTAVPYIRATVPQISTWDVETIKGYMASEVLEQTPEENFLKIVDYLSRMGELRELEEPEFESVRTRPVPEGGEEAIVTYTVDALYENGEAEIAISLLEAGDSFKVYRFNVSSMALER